MFELQLENESANIVNINDGVNYQVISCTGLNPPSASIFTAKSPNRKGVKYNGSTLNERNIVLTIKILRDIEANRNALYDWTDTEQYCKIHYKNGLKNVYCEGHIQDCEIDLFTSDEVIGLAIICEDPYWKDLTEVVTDISTLLAQFTIPFAIEEAGIPFSTIRTDNTTSIFNAGAETGCKITIHCNNDVENFVLYDARDTSKQFKINLTLEENWTVIIDTEASPKTVKAYKPNGDIVNLLRYVNPNPTWFVIERGNNFFSHDADNGTDVYADVQIAFTNRYLGV